MCCPAAKVCVFRSCVRHGLQAKVSARVIVSRLYRPRHVLFEAARNGKCAPMFSVFWVRMQERRRADLRRGQLSAWCNAWL
jgi:hypothetical protein